MFRSLILVVSFLAWSFCFGYRICLSCEACLILRKFIQLFVIVDLILYQHPCWHLSFSFSFSLVWSLIVESVFFTVTLNSTHPHQLILLKIYGEKNGNVTWTTIRKLKKLLNLLINLLQVIKWKIIHTRKQHKSCTRTMRKHVVFVADHPNLRDNW